MNRILIVLSLSALAGFLYRAGGQGKPFNTCWRDIGVSLVTLATCLILGLYTGFIASLTAYLLTFALSWTSLASYFGLDEQKYGFWAHGLALSLAVLPIAYITGLWLGFVIRCVILTAFITLWSEFIKWDVLEEWGRGVGITLSLPLLLI